MQAPISCHHVCPIIPLKMLLLRLLMLLMLLMMRLLGLLLVLVVLLMRLLLLGMGLHLMPLESGASHRVRHVGKLRSGGLYIAVHLVVWGLGKALVAVEPLPRRQRASVGHCSENMRWKVESRRAGRAIRAGRRIRDSRDEKGLLQIARLSKRNSSRFSRPMLDRWERETRGRCGQGGKGDCASSPPKVRWR